MRVMRGALRTKLIKLVRGIGDQRSGLVAQQRARMKVIRSCQTGGAHAGSPAGKV